MAAGVNAAHLAGAGGGAILRATTVTAADRGSGSRRAVVTPLIRFQDAVATSRAARGNAPGVGGTGVRVGRVRGNTADHRLVEVFAVRSARAATQRYAVRQYDEAVIAHVVVDLCRVSFRLRER